MHSNADRIAIVKTRKRRTIVKRLWLLSLALGALGGCATQSAYNQIATEQEHCAGYWRSTGDSDRASEMSRRGTQSRIAANSVDPWEDFIGTVLLDLIGGRQAPKPMEPPRHPSDGRGCQ